MKNFSHFMGCDRRETPTRAPGQRVLDWEEFHLPLSAEQRSVQGTRCMNCGVPYCQSGIQWEGTLFGCPLHNLIPEWNDMIAVGNQSHALSRLLKANNFPEFTGRVCPAPCEHACICGIYGKPVTIRDNELHIVEACFADQSLPRRRPPQWSDKKVAVVGSGPSGLAVADQLNHRGHSVTVLERETRPGGLLTYGIPNMKLPKSVVSRRIELMTDEGISFVTGVDAAVGKTAQRLLVEYDAVVLCCGAEDPRPLGVDTAGTGNALYGTEYLKAAVERWQFGMNPAVPSAFEKNVVIVGTGDTASDCVATALREKCRSVTQLVRRKETDYLDAGGALPFDYAMEEAMAVFGKDPRRFGVQIQKLLKDPSGRLTGLVTTDGDTLPCDLLIAATGFSGCRADVCQAFGVEMEQTVRTAEGSYRTNVEKVFSAGDMRRGPSLVVWAIAEGRAAAAEVDAYLTGYTNLAAPI